MAQLPLKIQWEADPAVHHTVAIGINEDGMQTIAFLAVDVPGNCIERGLTLVPFNSACKEKGVMIVEVWVQTIRLHGADVGDYLYVGQPGVYGDMVFNKIVKLRTAVKKKLSPEIEGIHSSDRDSDRDTILAVSKSDSDADCQVPPRKIRAKNRDGRDRDPCQS